MNGLRGVEQSAHRCRSPCVLAPRTFHRANLLNAPATAKVYNQVVGYSSPQIGGRVGASDLRIKRCQMPWLSVSSSHSLTQRIILAQQSEADDHTANPTALRGDRGRWRRFYRWQCRRRGVIRGAVNYVAQFHAGTAAARIAALPLPRGELIAFLDADDLWWAGAKIARCQIARVPSRA